jgi:hypothetical protein
MTGATPPEPRCSKMAPTALLPHSPLFLSHSPSQKRLDPFRDRNGAPPARLLGGHSPFVKKQHATVFVPGESSARDCSVAKVSQTFFLWETAGGLLNF